MRFRRFMAVMLVMGLIAVAFGFACSDSSDLPADEGPSATDQVDDADAHDDGAAATDDADAHDDATGDDDAEENAFLEAAPKEALFLVNMSLFSFTPNILEVKAGEVVEIAIQNTEAALHDFTIDNVDADVHISYLGGTGQHEHEAAMKEADVHFALTEPGSGVVHLKINEPGEYVFYCSVPGHQELGMEGTLIVTEG